MSSEAQQPNPEQEPLFRRTVEHDSLTEQEASTIAQRLGSLVLDDDTVLGEHQQSAFKDITSFFADGGTECYAQMPTSTGKTVLFVEICKKFINPEVDKSDRRRAIVLAPTVDLVDQIVGSVDETSGKRRGFKGFAPELDVRAQHSQLSLSQRNESLADADVLVTTYSTFRNLIKTFLLASSKTDEQWDEEKYRLFNESEKAEIRRQQLLVERRVFVQDAYHKQEIAKLGRLVEIMLPLTETKKHYEKHKKDLTELQEVINNPVLELNSKVKFGRKIMRRWLPDELRHRHSKNQYTLEKVEDVPGLNSAQALRTNVINGPIKGVKQEKPRKNINVRLNSIQTFAFDYIRRHNGVSFPTTNDLDSEELRKRHEWYKQQIRNEQSNTHTHKRGAKNIDQLKEIGKIVSQFDLLVGDEFHRAIGSETWSAICNFAQKKGIAILGLTATDEYFDRSLEDYLQKVHELTREEAIAKEIVNPLSIFVHNTGLRFQNVGLDPGGEYDRLTIREMRFSHERNMIGVDYAKTLSEHGYHGLMSAIPGDGGEHAKVLTDLINQQEIIDPKTGYTRLMRAQYILNDTVNRNQYYDQLESGELDWLVFIDVIREGFDRDNAKALINMRPSRSPLLVIQRMGRVGRTFPGAPVSIVIDLFDGMVGEESHFEIPPVLAVDTFGLNNIEQGHVIGSAEEQQSPVIDALKQKMTDPIVAHHTQYIELLKKAYIIDGRGLSRRDGSQSSTTEWQTFEAIQKRFSGFLPKEVLLDAMDINPPQVRAVQGKRGGHIIPLFSIEDVVKLHNDKPEINPWRLYVDESGEQWITPEGCTKLLSQRFPRLESETVVEVINRLESNDQEKFKKEIGRIRLNFGTSHERMGLVYMYKFNEIKDRLVPYMLEHANSEGYIVSDSVQNTSE